VKFFLKKLKNFWNAGWPVLVPKYCIDLASWIQPCSLRPTSSFTERIKTNFFYWKIILGSRDDNLLILWKLFLYNVKNNRRKFVDFALWKSNFFDHADFPTKNIKAKLWFIRNATPSRSKDLFSNKIFLYMERIPKQFLKKS
jgi:hypothetical protein